MTAPWYLHEHVLDILDQIRTITLPVTPCTDDTGRIREEWQRFDDGFVSSLEAWREGLDLYSPDYASDVAAAVTGQRLVGTHYLSDEARLVAIRSRVDAALAARVMAVAA